MTSLPKTKVDVYTIIADQWNIPRHRVKTLLYAGACGVAGSEKTEEQWRAQLDAWDDTEDARVQKALTTVVKEAAKKGRFTSNVRGLLGLKK